MTGAPGKAFLVKTPPKRSVGSSRTTRVKVIGRGSFTGLSRGKKLMRRVPTRKPRGSSPIFSRYAV
jgi:hypothetical protein